MTGQPASILAWHFCGDTLRDGRSIPADGETLTYDGPIEMGRTGLHASRRIINAFEYAPGPLICRVECWGDVIEDNDKLVARNRRILWRVDGEAVLWEMARKSALSVIHLWDVPKVVQQYLTTGDETIRATARPAAWTAVKNAARAAELDDTWDGTMDAARYAMVAACAAMWYTAMDAARYAGRNAMCASPKDTAWNDANDTLTRLVEAARTKP